MRVILSLVVLLLLGVDAAAGQWRAPRGRSNDVYQRMGGAVEFGVRGGYDFDAGVGLAGSQVRVPLIRQLLIVPSGDVFFEDDDSAGETAAEWQLNLDLLARPDELGGLYVGAGAAFVNAAFEGGSDDEVEAGYNLIAGLEGGSLLRSRLRPFAEARWTFVDDFEPFRLVVGINTPVR